MDHAAVGAVEGGEAVDEVEAVLSQYLLQILMMTWRSTVHRLCRLTEDYHCCAMTACLLDMTAK